MKPRRILTTGESCEIIDAAVRDGALAVIAVQSGADWHNFKSRFLERDPNRKFIVLDYQDLHGRQLPTIAPGQYVGISFRYKSRKVMFATVVEARGKFMGEGGDGLAAIRYRWPESMTELQRRAYYRTPIPPGVNLLVSAWQGGIAARDAAQMRPLHIVTGSALDLSCGGTLVQLHQATPPPWSIDQTVGVELALPDGRPPILLDAHYRGSRCDAEGNYSIAVQFVGLEVSVDGRALLQRLARCLQQFHRQTLMPDARSGQSWQG